MSELKTYYPEVQKQEIKEAQEILGLQTTKQSKANLDQLLQIVKGSDYDQADSDSNILVKAYAIMMIYTYLDRQTYIEQTSASLQQIILAIQHREMQPFGQLYGVLILTKLLQLKPTFEFLLNNNIFSIIMALLKKSPAPVYEIQLLHLLLEKLTRDVQLQITDHTKNNLVDAVRDLFLQKLIAQDEFLHVFGGCLILITKSHHFMAQVVDISVINQCCVSLSAWYALMKEQPEEYKMKPTEAVTLMTLIRVISVVFQRIEQLKSQNMMVELHKKALQIMQDLDIIAIIQSMVDLVEEAGVFFNINAGFRDFCHTCHQRFQSEQQIPVLQMIPFMRKLLELYPVHGLVFIRGCILDEEVLNDVVNSELTQDIAELITEAILKDRAPGIIVYVAHLLQAMFRSPGFFIDFNKFDLPASGMGQTTTEPMTAYPEDERNLMSERKFAVCQQFFKLTLQIVERSPSNEMLQALYLQAHLKINLIPFMHQASNISLLRTKFRICQDRAVMPKPSDDEIRCLVKLLLNPYLKLSAQLPFALNLFSRYEEKQSLFKQINPEIAKNCSQMLSKAVDLVERYVKKQEYKDNIQVKIQVIQLTKDSILEVLKLLCQIKAHNVGEVLKLWESLAQLGDVREQNLGYVEETAKFVKFLIVQNNLQKEMQKQGGLLKKIAEL